APRVPRHGVEAVLHVDAVKLLVAFVVTHGDLPADADCVGLRHSTRIEATEYGSAPNRDGDFRPQRRSARVRPDSPAHRDPASPWRTASPGPRRSPRPWRSRAVPWFRYLQ